MTWEKKKQQKKIKALQKQKEKKEEKISYRPRIMVKVGVSTAQRLFSTDGNLARSVTFLQRHFSTEGHFCTASLLHRKALLHGVISARYVILAQ